MIATLQPKAELYYPESDGAPLAETDLHAQEMVALFQALQDFFGDGTNVYVAMNNFIYYEQGNPAACIAPDVYVVKGVSNRLRDTFKVWEEGNRVPNAIFEITSLSTKKNDVVTKKRRSEQLGVPEYFLFDPKAEYLRPNLQGFSLQNGMYEQMKPSQDGSLRSAALGLKFELSREGLLRVTDLATGRVLARKKEEAEARRAAEAEVVRLKAELARLKK